MTEAAIETLETMFFAVPDSISESASRPDGALIAVSLSFHGSPDGHFSLLVSEPLARTLAANFIGCEEADVAPLQVTSVAAELANMICGTALTKIESDASFDLAAPETIRISRAEPAPAAPIGTSSVCRLEFPEGTLVLYLAFGESA